jgi:penicillin-binding protein 1C
LTTLHRQPTEYGLGLTIGNAEVNLLELTNAYATLARLGEHLPTTFLPDQEPTSSYPFTSDASYLITDILADNSARSAAFGIHSSLRLPFPCAVKTGTSSDFRDNWCLGFTGEFTVGVWVGNFDNSPMAGISGVSGAGPIFHRTMLALHEEQHPTFPKQPATLRSHLHRRTNRPPLPHFTFTKHALPTTRTLLQESPSPPHLSHRLHQGKQSPPLPRIRRVVYVGRQY